MYNPVATYRIQFHKGFNFKAFEKVIPYLVRLGVKMIYASPIFEAVPESMHGYDTVNPLRINPEIGTLGELRRITKKLSSKGIGWLQDIVPNHMAYHANNTLLMDLLEKGPKSEYVEYFDQGLADDMFKGPIMVPFLGSPLAEVIKNGELKIIDRQGKLYFKYFENTWPLNTGSYKLYKTDPSQLEKIANAQHYRLCSYEETDQQINFRRFFTVNSLICLNIQHKKVFDHFHQLIGELCHEGVFQGLRVDHIDGLYNPAQYLENLRQLAGPEIYIMVEKILEQGEKMQADWPVQGNTGYDFLGLVNNLFTNKKYKKSFSRFYKEQTKDKQSVKKQIAAKKTLILSHHMNGELDNLADLFMTHQGVASNREKVKKVIAGFLIGCPVYRFYSNVLPLSGREAKSVQAILKSIKINDPELSPQVDALQSVLFDQVSQPKAVHFYHRLMQFTGPLMAKGVEDTLMYTYNRFIDHNEVGDSPGAFGISVKDFHKEMRYRQQRWPLSLNGTATHDTKKGEDVRARLNVLSDIGGEWLDMLATWRELNADIRINNIPDPNDELFIYQTLVGTYPLEPSAADDYLERITTYLEKTLREGKRKSDWAKPNLDYEALTKEFARNLIDKERPFFKSFTAFREKLLDYEVVNSLSQVLLKFTCPGVPDIYQGCENWDLSLVDPDNRRPVDYNVNKQLLEGWLASQSGLSLRTLWERHGNGQIKVSLTHLLLEERKANPDLFKVADYLPLTVKGKYKKYIYAFARCFKNTWYITVTPLHIAELCAEQQKEVLNLDWRNTRLILPKREPLEYTSIVSAYKGKTKSGLAIADVFKELPIGFLKLHLPASGRDAGVLMPVFSLPSKFGIGDLGPEAISFADLLYQSKMSYWQMLPLNPVTAENQYSPYSSNSSMAGNTLFISPELLVTDGWLTTKELDAYHEENKGTVNYLAASQIRNQFFDKAWVNFKDANMDTQAAFTAYCQQQAGWLDDFSIYVQLKRHFNNKPWYEWPENYKSRKKNILTDFIEEHDDDIQQIKWLQHIFSKQWHTLKAYCNERGIRLIGDLPFYISYDSADVWAHPELFSLDNKLQMKAVAGVPPDYFAPEGQLWGMPVFNWDAHQKNFNWWTSRIQKNMEIFDLVRLDHFRAFSTYWSVPAGEKTAVNGTWEQGPGTALFKILKGRLGKLPFIAEDLGDIDQSVYDLRDQFGLPGMKVLQFAFGDDMNSSPHIPHNYTPNHVVYTGTHDNNTTRGWYKSEVGETVRQNLQKYLGLKVKDKNIAKIMIKTALASSAKTAIFPIQDILQLNGSARLNTPGSENQNWLWRLKPSDLKDFPVKKLQKWLRLYNRL